VRITQAPPQWVEQLAPRQRDLVRVIYFNGGATVREIHAQIPDAPASICGIRTLLNRLVRKGLLKTRRSGRHSEVIYLPGMDSVDVKLRAFDRIAREHFNGSKARAIDALQRLAANRASHPDSSVARHPA
jgi:predicted transcriptional regulator